METIIKHLNIVPYRWLITGAAGFIGSHLCEFLLSHGQKVIAIDNFETGFLENIQLLEKLTSHAGQFIFHEGDIRDASALEACGADVDFILHQAALGSVPRSIETPLRSHDVNVNGTLQLFDFYRKNKKIRKVVYASSSSVYGDAPQLPKKEENIGLPLSPYAASKMTTEFYAHGYAKAYDRSFVGLRYFNVFGPRQSPEGAYAAVIPRWIAAVKAGTPLTIFGDGETTRDFCFIENVIFANILAALSNNEGSHVYNVACGNRISLKDLAQKLIDYSNSSSEIIFEDFRPGDIQHSLADVSKVQKELGYIPLFQLDEGLKKTLEV